MIPQPLVETRQLGRWRIHAIQGGGQRLDGGAMFGVVPKPLWERRMPADERNRIQLGMRCLLIEHDVGLVLIDNGAGNKETEKFHDIYGIENGAPGPTGIEMGLQSLGYSPSDVKLVINSHLHFDHAGGNTTRDAGGAVRPTFPNARYVIQQGEYDYATHTNERTAGSYFSHNFVPLQETGVIDFIDGETDIVAGIRAIPTPGHTPHHQSLLVDGGGERLCFIADLVPTTAHLQLPWIMGYDVEPLVTLATKRRILPRAVAEDWLVLFEHDPTTAWSRITKDSKSFALRV